MNEMKRARLRYIFIAGVEGCGHHGLNPVISTALSHSSLIRESSGVIIRDKHRLKRIFNWYWCFEHPLGFTKLLVKAMINRFFRSERKKSLNHNQNRIIIEDNSFPAGKHRNLSKQWNIVEMVEMVRPYVDDIYIIGLYRDPIAAAFSHPHFDGGIEEHAEVVKKSQIYINEQLSKLNNIPQLIVRYEDLLSGQKGLGKELSEFLGISQEDMAVGFSKVRPSRKDWRKDMPTDIQHKMQTILGEDTAKALWPIFANAIRHSE